MKATAETSEFRQGWGVLLASAAGFGLGLSGLPFYTMGMFVEPLHKAFGWSTASILGGLTAELLTNIIALPIAAWLTERFGARPVALGSVVLYAFSFMALSTLNSSLVGYYLHWLLISATGAGTLAVVWTKGISGWFARARGTALGMAMMGTGITGVFAPLVANLLIERLGWRGAYAALALLPLVISLPLVWLLFKDRIGALGAVQTRKPAALVGPLITANWRFWIIGVSFFLVGGAVAGVIPNLVKLLRAHAFSPGTAAGVASLVGLFVIFGRLACGALLDRVWAAAVAAMFFVLAAVACLLLRGAQLDGLGVGVAAAAIGLAAGAEFDVLPYLTSRYFGVRRVGIALGLLSIFFYLGAAIGPFGFGRLADLAGGYDAPLLASAAALVIGGLLLLALGRYPADEAAFD